LGGLFRQDNYLMLPEKIKKELAEFKAGDYFLAYKVCNSFNILDNCTEYQNFICERLNSLRAYFRCVNPDKPTPILSEVVRCVWIATHYLYSYSLACDIQKKWTNPQYLVQLKETHPNYKYPEALADINKAGEYLHYAEYLLYSDKERHKKIHRAVQLKSKNIIISIWCIAGILKLLDDAVHNPKVKTFKELMQFILKNALINPKSPLDATRLKSLENYGSQASTKDEIELWNAFKNDRKYINELGAFKNDRKYINELGAFKAGFKNAISEKIE
ncbi:MAG: hypothetical protein K2Y14_09225, partial [Burkholderiales bacterium]|nr:hypothetical protein [Burkholderiales bacterium]